MYVQNYNIYIDIYNICIGNYNIRIDNYNIRINISIFIHLKNNSVNVIEFYIIWELDEKLVCMCSYKNKKLPVGDFYSANCSHKGKRYVIKSYFEKLMSSMEKVYSK